MSNLDLSRAKLFALYIEDFSSSENIQDLRFNYNPSTRKFEMGKDTSYGYTLTQIHFEDKFLLFTQDENENIKQVDKKVLFQLFDKFDLKQIIEVVTGKEFQW